MPQKTDGEILVVDDDPMTRKMLVRALSSVGYRCQESEDGLAAWEQMRRHHPNLILLDFEMPDLNGAELVRRIRAEGDSALAQTPTIMLTGHSDEQSEVLCLEAGADDFVTKPINLTVLRARIETHLRLRSMREQLRSQNEVLEAWRHNLQRDLAAARLTQQSLIPAKPPDLPGWDVASVFRPVIEVGGDIYGWVHTKNDRMLFWIADATGHGASAALITTLTKLLFHHGTAENDAPAAIMQAINNDFRGIFGGRSFMTAMCVSVDLLSGRTTVVGAGHPPLVIARQDGGLETIASAAPPLGLVESPQLTETTTELNRGDSFLLYTDGLLGSGDKKGSRATPETLGKLMDRSAVNAENILQKMLAATATEGSQGQSPDDIAAILVLRDR